MDFSFLIVTKERVTELQLTLEKLQDLIDFACHEVLVFIDGCTTTEQLITRYPWVKWTIHGKSIGASPARAILYQKAVGKILVGLDDDAHPISGNFLTSVQFLFNQTPNLGIIAFQEVKGLFDTDEAALASAKHKVSFFTNDFIGCGFAILNKVYRATNGFPTWIDIYGEEPCVAMEVLDAGYTIVFAHDIVVNHRIDKQKRVLQGKNYYRFERQLRNSFKMYVVYYPNPWYIICKLLFHNFRKYAMQDRTYFKLYWRAIGAILYALPTTLKNRNPIRKETYSKLKKLQNITY